MSKNSHIKKLLGLSTTLPQGAAGGLFGGLLSGGHSHGHAHGAGCGCGHSHDHDEDDHDHDHPADGDQHK